MHQKGFTIWITGLPRSGKSTLGDAVAEALRTHSLEVERIDSGKLRRSLLADTLGFSKEERHANNLHHAFAARLLTSHGLVAVVSAVSPYQATRQAIRKELGDFIEVYVNTPKEVCIQRDPGQIWAKALAGEIRGFTGVDDPYEPPKSAEVKVNMGELTVPQALERVMQAIEAHGWIEKRLAEESTDQAMQSRMATSGYRE